MTSKFDPSRVAFQSSGVPEEDARTAAMLRKNLANESEGLCPNGCAPLTWPKFKDVAECSSCGFIGVGLEKSDYPQGQQT